MSKLREVTGFVDVPDLPMLVNDWVCQHLQKTPTVETKIPQGDLVFIVRKVRRSKIHEMIVEKRQVLEKAAAVAVKGA